ncbi:conserved hypothetical protein [Acidithiobacillus caldus SM-1]|uniref:Uncharacterized protein n=2 Tax=Acidithiobacillus caldus TaxID=33059 RepID=F9ZQE8_ACICS|nr:conserved hypothetical protein [Acidithiobacillus caldus SM-1]
MTRYGLAVNLTILQSTTGYLFLFRKYRTLMDL